MAELLKYMAILLTGISAIIGILRKTHDNANGKLTRAGKVLLSVAVLGLGMAIALQIAESRAERQSVQQQLRRHQQILFGFTRFREMALVCLFESGVTKDSFIDPLKLQFNFDRGTDNELEIHASWPEEKSDYLELIGSQQEATVPLDDNVVVEFYPEFGMYKLEGPAFMVHLMKMNVEDGLKRQPSYKAWPYETLGDFKDVKLKVTASGGVQNKIRGMKIIFNAKYVLDIPLERLDGKLTFHDIDDIFLSLAELNEDH